MFAFVAALMRRLGFVAPAPTVPLQPTSVAISGIVPRTSSKPLRDGMPPLEARALMFYNRDKEKAARYLERHRALAMIGKGRCSDADY